MKYKGYWCLQLHAHLPFVRHPNFPDFLEEDWLYEAISETYLPILSVFENFVNDGIDFRVTMTITPTLANMLADPLLQSRYYAKLNKLIELSEKEILRTKNHPEFHHVALMYERNLKNCRRIWEKYHGNILTGFKNLQDMGKIEIITCCATHGFLPLMVNETAVRAQIRIACQDYKKHFGREPKGIWLAECAYTYGIDKILKEEGLRFFFLEAHGLLYASPRPRYGVFAPIYCPSGVAAFSRDMETAHQVWSADSGYPGDPDYREFYRDLAYDLDYNYIKPYLHSDGERRNIGIKYHRITGKVALHEKQPYNPEWAENKAKMHAENFVFNRKNQIDYLSGILGREPIVVSMYDAELFGHWWFEGPQFINHLFRAVNKQKIFAPITPVEYLEKFKTNQVATPSPSSWGDKGYFEVWLNSKNDWIYKHLHVIADRMVEIASANRTAAGLELRLLNQAARELLLAQSSDWAFIMTTGTMVEYAEKRTKEHIYNFNTLYDQIKNNNIDEGFLSNLEYTNNIFPDIDYTVYIK